MRPRLGFRPRRFSAPVSSLSAASGATADIDRLPAHPSLTRVTRSRHQTMFAPHAAFADCIITQRGKPDRIPAEFRIGGQAMESVIAKLLQNFEQGKMNRRPRLPG